VTGFFTGRIEAYFFEGDGVRIAAIGDIHRCFDEEDARWIDRANFDRVLFTGDLPGRWHQGMDEVARGLAALTTPAVLIPGNHDGPSVFEMLADQWGCAGSGRDSLDRFAVRAATFGQVELGGYSVHPLTGDTALLVARPLAMDGRKLSFAPAIERAYGVADLTASATRLKALVDDHDARRWVVLAHNGPAGLGVGREAPWGLGYRDLGDPDLAAVIDHLRGTGRSVPLVVAGHVHHRGDAGRRRWCVRDRGTTYVNAARVPRHEQVGGSSQRHLVSIGLDGDTVRVEAQTY
jgi:uncharacterized protein (TIGR04168 family)